MLLGVILHTPLVYNLSLCKNRKGVFRFYIRGGFLAHNRNRHILSHLRKLLGFSPVVGLMGHRQSGKTTLLGEIVTDYVTMDHRATLQSATSDPDGFISGFSKIHAGIDECQLVPEIFPAIKERVRIDKRPGQFILTGSVRFTSRKAIRESLTGRIINVNLHPLVTSELMGLAEPKIMRELLFKGVIQSETFLKKHSPTGPQIKVANKILESYGQLGGLPGVCFVRDSGIRAQKLETQMETILDRDLRQVFETTLSYEAIRRVLTALALKNGQPLELAELSRKCRISVPTLRKLLVAFESLFLLHLIEAEGTEKRPAILFEDPGEANFLAEGRLDDLSIWSATVLSHVRSILDLPLTGQQKFICRFSQYRTRGGAFVPLVVRCGKATLGIIPMIEENPNAQIIGSANSFLRSNPGATLACVHPHSKQLILGRDLIVIPASTFLL